MYWNRNYQPNVNVVIVWDQRVVRGRLLTKPPNSARETILCECYTNIVKLLGLGHQTLHVIASPFCYSLSHVKLRFWQLIDNKRMMMMMSLRICNFMHKQQLINSFKKDFKMHQKCSIWDKFFLNFLGRGSNALPRPIPGWCPEMNVYVVKWWISRSLLRYSKRTFPIGLSRAASGLATVCAVPEVEIWRPMLLKGHIWPEIYIRILKFAVSDNLAPL